MASLRGARLPGRWARLSPDRAPRYWAAAAFVLAAGFAGAVALLSTNDIHRLWGETAACAYVASVVAVLVWRSRGIDLARRDPRDTVRGAATRLGWEGRMLAVGIGAMLGITAVAFVALSVYVAALVCGRVRTSVLTLEAADKP